MSCSCKVSDQAESGELFSKPVMTENLQFAMVSLAQFQLPYPLAKDLVVSKDHTPSTDIFTSHPTYTHQPQPSSPHHEPHSPTLTTSPFLLHSLAPDCLPRQLLRLSPHIPRDTLLRLSLLRFARLAHLVYARGLVGFAAGLPGLGGGGGAYCRLSWNWTVC